MNNINHDVLILDCTLRDGGYYTEWDFGDQLVSKYLNAVSSANIDMVELGLRNYGVNGYKGPHFYTTENYINSIHLPDGPKYGL